MLSAGTCVEWLRDDLGLIETRRRRPPRWPRRAPTPATCGSSRPCSAWAPRCGTSGPGAPCSASPGAPGRPELVRAVLEGVAHRGADLLEAAEADRGLAVDALRVDGGMSANDVFVPALADACGRPVEISPVLEATTLGAGFLAGLAVGTWDDEDDVAAAWSPRAGGRAARRPRPEADRAGPRWLRGPGAGRGHHPRAVGARLLTGGPAAPIPQSGRYVARDCDGHRTPRDGRPRGGPGRRTRGQPDGGRLRCRPRGPDFDEAVALAGRCTSTSPRCVLGTPGPSPWPWWPPSPAGHLLIEDVPGRGQDGAGPRPGRRPRGPPVAGPGPPGPAALRRHRGLGLLPGHRQLGVPARAGLRPRGAARRAQPDPAADPVGPARGHGGAAGHGRRRDLAPPPPPPGASPPRTRSASSAPTPWSRASSTASPCPPRSATPTPTPRPASSCAGRPRRRSTASSRSAPAADWARVIEATAAVHVAGRWPSTPSALVRATRSVGTVRLGASPRAAISLVRSAQAHALLYGRAYVTPDDVQAMAVAVPGPPPGHRRPAATTAAPWSARSSPPRPSPGRDPGGGPPPDPHPGAHLGVSALVVGMIAGTVGVLVARLAFGPRTALAGAAVGLVLGIPASLWIGTIRRGGHPDWPTGTGSGGGRIPWPGPDRSSAASSPWWRGPAWPTPAARAGCRPSGPCWPPSSPPGWSPRSSRRSAPGHPAPPAPPTPSPARRCR